MLRGSANAIRRSVLASLLVQTLSYVPLVIWYWLLSGTHLYTRFTIVPAGQIPLSPSAVVTMTVETGGPPDPIQSGSRLAVWEPAP